MNLPRRRCADQILTKATHAAPKTGSIPDDLRPGGKLDKFVAKPAAEDKFSGTVLLTHDNKPVLQRAYGMANKDPTRREPPTRLAGHTDYVTDVAWRPDGEWLASAGADGTVRLWPVRGQGDPITRRGQDEQIRAVAYHPHGAYVATGGSDGTARLWTCPECGAMPEVAELGEARTTRSLTPDEIRTYLEPAD